MATPDVRKIRCFDGLHYSFQMMKYYYSGLWETCCKIPDDNNQIIIALTSSWGFIDTVHRAREILQCIPGINNKVHELRIFLSATELAKEFRNYIQHLREIVNKNPPLTFPVLGSLSWVDSSDAEKSHSALFGTNVNALDFTSCVYDTQEKHWVSKVSLSLAKKTFHFDQVFDSTVRLENYLRQSFYEEVLSSSKLTEKIPIYSFKIPQQ